MTAAMRVGVVRTAGAMSRTGAASDFAVIPEEEPAEERVVVVACPGPRGEFLELLDVAPADHHVIGLERGGEPGHDVVDGPPPSLFAEPMQSPDADVVFKRRPCGRGGEPVPSARPRRQRSSRSRARCPDPERASDLPYSYPAPASPRR